MCVSSICETQIPTHQCSHRNYLKEFVCPLANYILYTCHTYNQARIRTFYSYCCFLRGFSLRLVDCVFMLYQLSYKIIMISHQYNITVNGYKPFPVIQHSPHQTQLVGWVYKHWKMYPGQSHNLLQYVLIPVEKDACMVVRLQHHTIKIYSLFS